MATDLLINATPYEIRIALVEHGTLVEFYQERPTEKGMVGNIYKGRVCRVLPGMQAAFVEVGLDRTGFLYVDDVQENGLDLERMVGQNGSCCCEPSVEGGRPAGGGKNISDLLHEGQEVLVQVCKEPMGSKGARLSCHITIPCRNLVFMPMTDHIGISRKIADETQRQRLYQLISELRPAGAGFIVRTLADAASREELEADMEFLLHIWSEINDIAAKAPVPSLVYADLDVILRVVRDIFSPQVDRVVVDDRATFDRVYRFVETFAPRLTGKVHLYEGEQPVFEAYGIEMDISRSLDRKIWLRCGGYIIIENTEALTVIDVNTGRYVGKTDLEETIFKTNMEAVKEISYQLRLRNIGGIIIIDFIDMEEESHRDEVFRALQEAFQKDKSRVNILKVSEFGLVQMTRKRNREDIGRMLCEPCPYCNGEGMVKSRRTVCYEIFRRISRQAAKIPVDEVIVRVNPQVADMMLNEEATVLAGLEVQTGKKLSIQICRDLHQERYEILW
ncbi:MAG: Rne/Rng family ribonuclease [Thermodesulfobacteriota bacterium]